MKYSKYCLPTLGQSWLLLLLTVLGQFIASALVAPFVVKHPDVSCLKLTLPYILTFVPPFLYVYFDGRSRARENAVTGAVPSFDLDRTELGGVHPVLFIFAITVSVYAASMALDPFNIWMPVPEWFEKLMEQATVDSDFFWSFFTVAVCAPLFEETLCRGIICRGLLSYCRSPWSAILWSAFIFAVMHLNPWQGIPAFLLGVWFGWIYYRTRSIKATMFLHFLNNGTVVVLGHFFPETAGMDTISAAFGSMDLYWLAVALSAAVFIIANLVLLNRFLPHRTNNS